MSCLTQHPFLSNFASGNAGLEEDRERVFDRERERFEDGAVAMVFWHIFVFDELCDNSDEILLN